MADEVKSAGTESEYEVELLRSVLAIASQESTPSVSRDLSISQPLGVSNGKASDGDKNSAGESVELPRAWDNVTRFLDLRSSPNLNPNGLEPDERCIRDCLFLVQYPSTRLSLSTWYLNNITQHFQAYVEPAVAIREPPRTKDAGYRNLFLDTVQVLTAAFDDYTRPVRNIEHALSGNRAEQSTLASFRRRIISQVQALFRTSIPRNRLRESMSSVLLENMRNSLSQSSKPYECERMGRCKCTFSMEWHGPDDHTDPTEGLLVRLQRIGFDHSIGQQALAYAVDNFLNTVAVERPCFAVDWHGMASVSSKFEEWVETYVVDAIQTAYGSLTGSASYVLPSADRDLLIKKAINALGYDRTSNLFDYVKAWPKSKGALGDIGWYLSWSNSRGPRISLCDMFEHRLKQRLLHAGASTAEILSFYINMIYSFKLLDARGVLLEKVSHHLQSYLQRERDNTVSVVAASFMANVKEQHQIHDDDSGICHDITAEVASSAAGSKKLPSLNWNDPNWVPDPIDANPRQNSGKTGDVVEHVLSLFGHDDFVKEINALLAQHLLSATDSQYLRETRIVELLKSRLDGPKLQTAEVMLKDMRDSADFNKRINSTLSLRNNAPPNPREIQAAIPEDGITLLSLYRRFEGRINQAQFHAVLRLVANRRGDLLYPKRTRPPRGMLDSAMDVHPSPSAAQDLNLTLLVLSDFFWPEARKNQFRLPSQLLQPRQTFETEFQKATSQRRLEFRDALARVSLEIELEDGRKVEERMIPAWRASVLDAFTAERSDEEEALPTYDPAIGLTCSQLEEGLQMEEELVVDALTYWTSKQILYQVQPGSYAVLERLDMDTGPVRDQTQRDERQVSAMVSQDVALRQNAPLFQVYILNMLQNQGPMDAASIETMLKGVLQIFTYGADELGWLLGDMERNNQVAREGDRWRAL